VDLSAITDPAARQISAVVVQISEAQAAEIALVKETNQQLRAEVARLKGEQGKPTIPPRPAGHSSEQERPADRPLSRPRAERRAVVVDREEVRRVDRSTLPAEAEYKGLAPFVVQEVVLRTDTVRSLREKWSAPSTGQTYLADLPAGVTDHFGPQVTALALAQVSGVSEPQILTLLGAVGLRVSASTLSAWLTTDLAALHAEAVDAAGLASSPWQQIDDTSTRVTGVPHHGQVVGNPLYTSYPHHTSEGSAEGD